MGVEINQRLLVKGGVKPNGRQGYGAHDRARGGIDGIFER